MEDKSKRKRTRARGIQEEKDGRNQGEENRKIDKEHRYSRYDFNKTVETELTFVECRYEIQIQTVMTWMEE